MAVVYFMVKSCIHTVLVIDFIRPPEPHKNMPYLSPYDWPVQNSAKFCGKVEIPWFGGKFCGWAQNSAFHRKLWSLIICRLYSIHLSVIVIAVLNLSVL